MLSLTNISGYRLPFKEALVITVTKRSWGSSDIKTNLEYILFKKTQTCPSLIESVKNINSKMHRCSLPCLLTLSHVTVVTQERQNVRVWSKPLLSGIVSVHSVESWTPHLCKNHQIFSLPWAHPHAGASHPKGTWAPQIYLPVPSLFASSLSFSDVPLASARAIPRERSWGCFIY